MRLHLTRENLHFSIIDLQCRTYRLQLEAERILNALHSKGYVNFRVLLISLLEAQPLASSLKSPWGRKRTNCKASDKPGDWLGMVGPRLTPMQRIQASKHITGMLQSESENGFLSSYNSLFFFHYFIHIHTSTHICACSHTHTHTHTLCYT